MPEEKASSCYGWVISLQRRLETQQTMARLYTEGEPDPRPAVTCPKTHLLFTITRQEASPQEVRLVGSLMTISRMI